MNRHGRADGVNEETTQLLVRIPASLHRAVRERAASEERTLAVVVRRALDHYMREVPSDG